MRFSLFNRTVLILSVGATALAVACAPAFVRVFASDGYQVVHTYPHDHEAYTQGLVYLGGHLYESTGLNGHSTVREEEVETGRILQLQDVPEKYFAEGLAAWDGTLIQLTWQSHVALVYDRTTLRFLRTMQYAGEGWGLTEDGHNLILSDGTAKLRFLDPATFREVRRITVKDHGLRIDQLNELEYIHGQIYANIWHSDRIARIDPASGKVLGWIDLSGLLPAGERANSEAVLNGIAYDAEHDRLFVTGKLWPHIFEIKVIASAGKGAK
jgi:glutamine cyclotransferase